jgi:hypothetical protein
MAKVVWHGDAVQRAILGILAIRLERAADELVRHARRRCGRIGKSRTGGYPSKRTGWHRDGLDRESDRKRLIARWGTNVKGGKKQAPYPKILELRTGKGKRPWMSLTNKAKQTRVRRILTAPIRGTA